MRMICIAVVVSAVVSPAMAEEKTIPLPQITIGGEPTLPGSGQPHSPGSDQCGGAVSADSSHAFDCLNSQLKQEVDRINPGVPTAPIDNNSSDLKLGLVNIPAVKQQYGQNFGVSVVPYRPPMIYGSPLGAR
jgi:hypothetical protein